MEYKRFPVAEFKAEAKPGEFKALVAVFDNVDDGGDRILPGAFRKSLKSNPRPPIVWSHMWDIPPIGQTLTAKETDVGLEIHGQLLLDDPGISGQYANSVHSGMKAGVLKEFSFAYEVTDSAEVKEEGANVRELKTLDVFEVGPTLIGMNRQTQLLEVAGRSPNALDELADKLVERIFAKELDDKAAIGSHSSATTEGTWDGPAAMARASNAASPAQAFHAICAWYSGSNPEERQSYKFPHHNSPGGPAVLAGVRNALARVPQADIPSGDVAGVKAHLQRHLDDAKSINLTDAEEAAAPSPEEDERRAAQLAEINRLKNLIPQH